jgi:hypothetical protein
VRWDFGYCGHYWPIVPAPGDSDGDCGEIGGMKIGRGNRSTRRKPYLQNVAAQALDKLGKAKLTQ